jgi:hypothetical protein
LTAATALRNLISLLAALPILARLLPLSLLPAASVLTRLLPLSILPALHRLLPLLSLSRLILARLILPALLTRSVLTLSRLLPVAPIRLAATHRQALDLAAKPIHLSQSGRLRPRIVSARPARILSRASCLLRLADLVIQLLQSARNLRLRPI